VTLWPLPASLGMDSTSCAYRAAVIDTSAARDEPSVYVFRRYSNLRLVSHLGSTLFSGPMPLIGSSIIHRGSQTEISTRYGDGRPLFSASVERAGMLETNSRLFDTTKDFVSFIKGGMSSYAPSLHSQEYSRVDLVEDSNFYEPVRATIGYNLLCEIWPEGDLIFDSSYHATGGRYVLRYLGTVFREAPKSSDVESLGLSPIPLSR
jgi:hypothetical protein